MIDKVEFRFGKREEKQRGDGSLVLVDNRYRVTGDNLSKPEINTLIHAPRIIRAHITKEVAKNRHGANLHRSSRTGMFTTTADSACARGICAQINAMTDRYRKLTIRAITPCALMYYTPSLDKLDSRACLMMGAVVENNNEVLVCADHDPHNSFGHEQIREAWDLFVDQAVAMISKCEAQTVTAGVMS